MKIFRCLGCAGFVGLALLISSGNAYAGNYSCKGDRKLDVPMQFTPLVQSAGRVHVSASGGSDKSKYVAPSSWKVFDSTNAQVDYFPKGLVAFVSMNMFKEVNIEGLLPGETYTIELDSVDFCNNVGIVKKTVTMPVDPVETIAPNTSTPALVQVGLQAFFTEIQLSTTDNTGVREVAVYANGVQLADYVYYDRTHIRWWCDNYAADNTLSTLEGPNYYISYPESMKGSSALVEVVVTDVYGNQTVQSALLGL
jgi:hypothetical protein